MTIYITIWVSSVSTIYLDSWVKIPKDQKQHLYLSRTCRTLKALKDELGDTRLLHLSFQHHPIFEVFVCVCVTGFFIL